MWCETRHSSRNGRDVTARSGEGRAFLSCGPCFSARHAAGRDGRRQDTCGQGAAVAGRMARCRGHLVSAGKRKTAAMHGHRPRQAPAGCGGRHVWGRHGLHACDGKDAGQPDTGRACAGGRCASAHGPDLRTGPGTGRRAGSIGRGGRAGRGPRADGRPPARQEAACKDAQAQRGTPGHAEGPHAATGSVWRVVEGQRGSGALAGAAR